MTGYIPSQKLKRYKQLITTRMLMIGCGRVMWKEMGGDDGRRRPSTTSIRRLTSTGILLLMTCFQLTTVDVAASSLCDRCETNEVRALRRYYLTLNLSSV